eukprot:XP_011672759.1 PREDICTED: uncharacterized protein LOC105442394 [Strongylocentrotus purpuratus]
MCVHLFGGTWSPSCCSYALRRTAEDNKGEFSPEAVKAVTRNFYVDDCLISTKDEEDAIRLAQELKSLLEKGGFNLIKWTSNNRKVVEAIPVEDRSKQVKDLDLSKEALPVERALGIKWDVQEDSLEYKTLIKEKPLTRRGLLSIVSSIYTLYECCTQISSGITDGETEHELSRGTSVQGISAFLLFHTLPRLKANK